MRLIPQIIIPKQINKTVIFFFQHSLSGYNLEFFKSLKENYYKNLFFFFDFDPQKNSSKIEGDVKCPCEFSFTYKDRTIELYFSKNYIENQIFLLFFR